MLHRACKDREGTEVEILAFGLVSGNRPALSRPERPIPFAGARCHYDQLDPDRDRRRSQSLHQEAVVACGQLVRFDPDPGGERGDE